MKTRLLFIALFVYAFTWGQSIFTNPITGVNPNLSNPYTTGQVVDPNLTVSGIGRGAGAIGTGATNRYNANSWNTATIDLDAYFEFTLTPNSGYLIDFLSFSYTGERSGTGPTSFAFRSSVDGYTSNIGAPTATGTTISLASAAYQGISSAITFRIYGWGASGAPGTFSINDFTFNGYVYSTVPAAPVITSTLNASGFVGVPFTYNITAINSPTSYTAVGLPAGLSINTTTGVISGTPTGIGTFFVTISAINGVGNDEQTLIITVTNPGPEINLRGASGGTNPIVSGNTIPNAFNNTLFAGTTIGSNQDKDFRIENIGIGNLLISGTPRVEILGINAADFTVITQPAASVLPGANSVFVIRFSPIAGGIRNATVSIINNDSDENPYTFAIQGVGIAPDINIVGNGNQVLSGSLTPDSNNHTNFGNANIAGGTKLRNFYIINLGGATLDITNVSISGPNAADFAVTTTPSATVAINNSTTLGITFDPSALGLRQATVTVLNNVPGKSPFTFAISGVGTNFDECLLGGLSLIKQQTFEGATGATVMDYSVATALGANMPVVTDGTAFGIDRSTPSDKFLNSNSLQVSGPYPSSFDPKAKVIVTFDTVDSSTFQDVALDLKIGGFSANDFQGLDVSDWLTVFVSGDGGATWSREVIVKGNNNSIWGITAGGSTFTNPFKGLDIPYEVQANNNSVGNGVRVLTLSNLPQTTQLRIKIEMDIDRDDEIWVIDDVRLRGRLSSPTTWNGTSWNAGTPNSFTRAVFNGPYDTATDGVVVACECQINAGRTVIINPGDYIQSSGRIVNNGTLTIQNDGSLIQLDDYAVNTGNINLTRTANIRRQDYVYWSSPVSNFPVLNISPLTPAAVVFKWLPTISDNFGNWTNANENMVLGKGYIVRGPSTYNNIDIDPFDATFIGVPNNGIIQTEIQRGDYTGGDYPSPTNPLVMVTSDDDNFNLVGNPFPSAIRALDFLDENTNIEGSVRIWTHGILPDDIYNDPFYNSYTYNYNPNDYIVHNGTGTVSGPGGFNGFIASGQGFFILMNDGSAATETVTFKNSMRNITYDNDEFFRTSRSTFAAEEFRIWLDFIPENGNPVRTLIGYVDGATNEKDRLFDASTKEDNSSKMYSLIGDSKFIIQGRSLPFDANDIVNLGYNTTESGNYTVAIATVSGLNSIKVYLKDNLLNLMHDLTTSPYSFVSNVGTFDNRFELRYQNEVLGNPDFSNSNSSVIAFGSNGKINIKSSVQPIVSVEVYDLLGRQFLSEKITNLNEVTLSTNVVNQAVIAKIKLESGEIITRKISL